MASAVPFYVSDEEGELEDISAMNYELDEIGNDFIDDDSSSDTSNNIIDDDDDHEVYGEKDWIYKETYANSSEAKEKLNLLEYGFLYCNETFEGMKKEVTLRIY